MKRPQALVVEDDPDIRALLLHHLDGLGLQVQAAATGESACDALATTRPDIILLDLHLPGMDGVEVLHRVRRDPRTATVPVLVVSIADLGTPVPFPVEGWLVKPFTSASVRNQVCQILNMPTPAV